jgi:hypothetical protein
MPERKSLRQGATDGRSPLKKIFPGNPSMAVELNDEYKIKKMKIEQRINRTDSLINNRQPYTSPAAESMATAASRKQYFQRRLSIQ